MEQTKKTAKELHEVIIEITADFYGNDSESFVKHIGRSINHEMAYRKHICIFMLRTYTFISYKEIANLFTSPPSTIRDGYVKIEDLLSYNRRTIVEVAELKKLIDNFKANKRAEALKTFS